MKPREDYVDVFFRHLEQCAMSWTSQLFNSPYTSLVQASGTGKSRLLRELAIEKNVLVIYICLRGPESKGYPYRSDIANELTGKAYSEAHYLVFLGALFCKCSGFVNTQLQLHEKTLEKTCGRIFDILISDISDDMFNLQKSLWDNVRGEMKSRLSDTRGPQIEKIGNEVAVQYKKLIVTLRKLNKHSLKMLLAFDEARVLTENDNFCNLRRALQAVPDSGGFMALFTDTLSKVSNFSPANYHDPSSRISSEGEKLYKPFYLLDTLDCRMQKPPVVTVSTAMNQIRYMGRPIWADVADQAIIAFATEKILCDSMKAREIHETEHIVVIKKVTEALAILGPRLYLEISSLSQQAFELVSSHMRILRHVDQTRESLVTACPSEPVLAEAASHIMNRSGILVQVLGHLVSSIRNHIVVNAGDQGELVGRILCLLAIDKAIQSKPKVWNMYSQTITIQEFFDALVGRDSWKKLSSIFTIQANSVTLRDSKIRFNHFAYVEFTPTRLDLIEFFFRGAAVFCKRNQKGVDIIIPVAMVRDDETPITEENVTFISIQVRNREADGSTGDEEQQEGSKQSFKRQKMDNIFKQTARYIGIDDCRPFPLPYLGIYMSLGVTSEGIEYNNTLDIGVKTRTEAKDRMGHLSIYGFSKNVYACFNGADGDVIESLLHKLLISYVNPVEKENGILWGGHNASNEWIQQCKEIVKNMETLRYNQGEKEKRKRA
ncbi:hypothetical protein G9A89_015314 [Geosiphon pyriformis]|nr:hypothetical protein G9A89_015314 [Geosiphon pyriformis]